MFDTDSVFPGSIEVAYLINQLQLQSPSNISTHLYMNEQEGMIVCQKINIRAVLGVRDDNSQCLFKTFHRYKTPQTKWNTTHHFVTKFLVALRNEQFCRILSLLALKTIDILASDQLQRSQHIRMLYSVFSKLLVDHTV